MLGKLHETRSLSSSIARATDLTKITTYPGIDEFRTEGVSQGQLTWLNSSVSRSSFNFLFLPTSSNLT